MNSVIFQTALIFGMGTLATLLIKGMDLITALYRSVVVVMVMLGLMILAGIIVRWATIRRPPSDIEGSSTELESVEETE